MEYLRKIQVPRALFLLKIRINFLSPFLSTSTDLGKFRRSKQDRSCLSVFWNWQGSEGGERAGGQGDGGQHHHLRRADHLLGYLHVLQSLHLLGHLLGQEGDHHASCFWFRESYGNGSWRRHLYCSKCKLLLRMWTSPSGNATFTFTILCSVPCGRRIQRRTTYRFP